MATPHIDATTPDTIAHAGAPTPTRPDSADAEEARAFTVTGYEIVRELGRGGMGVVYEARQTALDRTVALKMVLGGSKAGREELQRFRSEAEAVARLTHPNIVQIYEVGQQEGMPYFSLEFMDGGSLEGALDGKPMDPRQASELIETLARAAHFAHQRGIVHRDLKPANILLSGDATPKIGDFGLAKRLDTAGQTETGLIMGTPRYMAPEQAAGFSHEVGPAADIYALGVILYHLLTGQTPFNDENSMSLLTKVVRDEPPRLRQLVPGVPADLETICLKCLEKPIEKRYGSALDLADDLRRFRNNEPIRARPVGRVERTWRWCQRQPAWATLVGVLLLTGVSLLGAGVWFHFRLQDLFGRTEQARQSAVALQDELQVSLARQIAQGVDSDLRQLADAPALLAILLGERSDWTEAQLEFAIRSWLDRDARVFGMCVAFEPDQFQKGVTDYALYVYRSPTGIVKKSLAPPALDPMYREWDWYKKARTRALWGEPYVDDGGGDVPMVTYSAPIVRQGKFAGVVTADLSLEYFDSLRQRLERVYCNETSYAMVVTQTGTILRHRNSDYRFPGKRSRFADLDWPPAVRETLLNGPPGTLHTTDPATDAPAAVIHVPIEAANWRFIVVVPRPAATK